MRRFLLALLLLLPLAAQAGPGEVRVYRGTSSYYSDIAFTYDGHLSTAEFIAVLYVVSDYL